MESWRHSDYLTRLSQQKFPSDDVSLERSLEVLLSIIDQFKDVQFEQAEDELITAKKRFSAHWGRLELSDYLSHAERGALLTKFADATIDLALNVSWRGICKKHRALNALEGAPPLGLFIIGLGKLGGSDLNFSSDVDLIAYFDSSTFPVPASLGAAYICNQLLTQMSKLLNQGGGLNFIWRVDWRLRPNASANSLATSTSAALDYYFYHASPWHRLALMKARVVAGDIECGNSFLKDLYPFIWRQNLDYRSLDELAEIKQRINAEHPGLKSERQWQEPIQDDISGFNVKLGTGGIREIEFVINALQLIWGGRKPVLQVTNTLQALQVLNDEQLLNDVDVDQLHSAYVFLRRLENALQLQENAHTHQVPSTGVSRDKLLGMLRIESWKGLVSELNAHRRSVNQHFVELFADNTVDDEAVVWLDGLGERATEIIEHWENGYQVYGASPDSRSRLRPLSVALSKYLRQKQDEADQVDSVIVRIHDYFRRLPRGEQYFRLLAQSPNLLDALITPLIDSPAMTVLLEQSPHIIDCFVAGDGLSNDKLSGESSVLAQPSYDAKLEALRRFVNEQLYKYYWAFLKRDFDVEALQNALSDLAEHSIELACRVVADEQGLDDIPVAVVALGKLGLRRMSPMSDLDLLFVFDGKTTDLNTATKFVSRLQTAISTKLREGVVYELDTRLRPSGRSGAPTVSIESLVDHHINRAHTWEHIAFMFARVVLGSESIEQQVNELKQQLVGRARDSAQLNRDAFVMWNRINEHRIADIPDDVFNTKLRQGGLMQIEFLTAYRMLNQSAEMHTHKLGFEALIRSCLPVEDADSALTTMQYWRTLQIYERLLGLKQKSVSQMPDRYRKMMFEQLGVVNDADMVEKNRSYSTSTMALAHEIFAPISTNEIDEWRETHVRWL